MSMQIDNIRDNWRNKTTLCMYVQFFFASGWNKSIRGYIRKVSLSFDMHNTHAYRKFKKINYDHKPFLSSELQFYLVFTRFN
jgi:hypothetical protein